MARKIKYQSFTSTVADCTELGELEDLAGEMREWYDNMSENLQGGDKGSQVDEAANMLEGLEVPDVPECVAELTTTYATGTNGGRKGDPRWLRRDNAVAPLEAARNAVTEWIGEAEDIIKELPEDAEDDSEVTIREVTLTSAELTTNIEEAQSFVDDLDRLIDDANGVEFPGMYG